MEEKQYLHSDSKVFHPGFYKLTGVKSLAPRFCKDRTDLVEKNNIVNILSLFTMRYFESQLFVQCPKRVL